MVNLILVCIEVNNIIFDFLLHMRYFLIYLILHTRSNYFNDVTSHTAADHPVSRKCVDNFSLLFFSSDGQGDKEIIV